MLLQSCNGFGSRVLHKWSFVFDKKVNCYKLWFCILLKWAACRISQIKGSWTAEIKKLRSSAYLYTRHHHVYNLHGTGNNKSQLYLHSLVHTSPCFLNIHLYLKKRTVISIHTRPCSLILKEIRICTEVKRTVISIHTRPCSLILKEIRICTEAATRGIL